MGYYCKIFKNYFEYSLVAPLWIFEAFIGFKSLYRSMKNFWVFEKYSYTSEKSLQIFKW